MVENPIQAKRNKFNNTKTRCETTQKSSNHTTPDSLPHSEHPNFNPNVIDEHTSLLSSGLNPQTEVKKGLQFYTYIFRHRSFVAALYAYMVFSILISAFEATLPLHVQEIFNWGSFPSGILFVLIGAPGILLNPLCGWLRDRLGTRHPTWIAFALLAPIMWLLGCPGDVRYPWANGANAQGIYIASVAGIGTVSCMLSSVAAVETRCKSLLSPPSHENPCFLLSTIPCFWDFRVVKLIGPKKNSHSWFPWRATPGHLRTHRGLFPRLFLVQHELDSRHAPRSATVRMFVLPFPVLSFLK